MSLFDWSPAWNRRTPVRRDERPNDRSADNWDLTHLDKMQGRPSSVIEDNWNPQQVSSNRRIIPGVSGISISSYNIISRLNPATVLVGVKGPLNYNYSTWPVGSRGDILLMKFASPYTFSKAVRNIVTQFPRLLYTAAGTYLNLGSSVDVEFDLFYLVKDYDPTTICWNNQPFGLSASGGGFSDTAVASFEADNRTGGALLGTYSYDNSLDDADASDPWIASSLASTINTIISTIVNATTFEINYGGDLSWLAGQPLAFTAGPPVGTTVNVLSVTNTSGVVWRIVVDAATTADTSTIFTAWMKLYGLGLGISSQFGITIAQMMALDSDPIVYLGTT